MKAIIISVTPGKTGVTLHLNTKTSMKGRTLQADEFWISWDKIGGLLFENYTDESDVEELRKLRGETK